MRDVDLLSAVAEGNVEALRTLHDQHASWLAARLFRRCSDWTLVEETVQDTFVTVWRTARRFRGEG
jgi:RNA polymerase sigma-70 factor (ECF subfamily)